ncbi:MAG TPA: response regulator transcription factor [Acidobacteriaceae bacterium]|jgi:DNA-binding response OmpR family regulator
MKVLVAEDKPAMADLLTRALRRDGHSVVVASDGQEALEIGRSEDCDIILLDLMLPRVDGFAVIRTLRAERRTTPTLIVSARDAIQDIVQGLDLGADDYLTKPFPLDVLLARVRALGRRLPQTSTSSLVFEDLEVDVNTHELRRNGRVSSLTRTEFALMELLMRRAGSLVSREALIEAGWGYGADVSESTLYVFISMLRAKIGTPQYLQTVRSTGYVLRP